MTRPPRSLAPRALYHVYNRALARRTAFETDADFRAFICLLVLAHRRYGIRILVFSLMPTHFHLLIEAPEDARLLSDAMRFVEGQYARYFNRGRKRDGPLWRSRYFAKEVRDTLYRFVLVAYIDANPVQARIVTQAAEYPHGSAALYQRLEGPRWLARERIELMVTAYAELKKYDPADYRRIFGPRPAEFARELVCQSMRGTGSPVIADLTDLVRAAPADVQVWMQRKAGLADGTSAGAPVAAVGALLRAAASMDGLSDAAPNARPRSPGGLQPPVAVVARAGLLRDAGGLSLREIARRLELSISTVERHVARHHRRVLADPAYSLAAGRAVAQAVRETLGGLAGAPVERLVTAEEAGQARRRRRRGSPCQGTGRPKVVGPGGVATVARGARSMRGAGSKVGRK